MKIKVRSHDASTIREDNWSQMGEWLASLRDGSREEPPGDGDVAEDVAGGLRSEALNPTAALAEARAEAGARAEAEASDGDGVGATAAERPVIGDQLRIPIMWCEMGSCISWYTDRAALGEADTRARAIDAGWRIDALGRLACPRCQQTDPCFWAARPVVPWDRYLAVVRAARLAVGRSDHALAQPSD